MSWSASLHRSAAPHPPEFARSAQEDPTEPTKPTKHELFAALVSGLDEVTTDASWKRTSLTEAVAVATSDGAVLRSSSALDGKVWVLVSGELTQDCITDMRELYGLPAKDCDSAELLLDLYEEGFCDKDGDWSDQPATALGVMEGSLSFMLFDEILGYLLLFRCPGSSMPLYWGTDADANDVLLLSTREARGVAQFPPGCAYESRLLEADPQGWSRLLNVTRHSPAARAVNSLPVVNSHGALCGMMFKSVSGRDLTQATVELDREVF